MTIRSHLLLMAAVILIPLVVLSAWALDMLLAAVAVPAANVETLARHAVFVAGLGVLVAIAVAVGVAILLARRLTRSIAGVAGSVGAIGRGDVRMADPSSVTEIDHLHGVIAEASANLLREKDARAQAEAGRARLFAAETAARRLAESQNQAKDDFLATLVHKLREPLTALSGAGSGAEDADAAVRPSDANARQIVDELLDLSRVMTGKILLDRHPVDLAEAARRCLAALRAEGRVDHHGVEVLGEPAWVDADAARLDQIINHLVVNALKYTPKNGSIQVEVGDDGTDAVLKVRDSGIGISEQTLPHVFDLFVQGAAPSGRAHGGLGIGLASVARLVSLHGGTVTAASESPGRGSTFTVRLPRVQAPESLAPSAALPAATPQGCRVLVVDDHTDGRRMLSVMLKLFGYEALEAHDGPEGLRIAATARLDAAIIDIGLPGIDGYEVARRLRNDPGTRSLWLIALTGYGQDEDRRRAYEAGFDVHLVKPVNPDLLTEAIAGATRRGHV